MEPRKDSFKTERDEAAFYRMRAMLAPDDQDEFTRIQNNRNPDGSAKEEDRLTLSRLCSRLAFGYDRDPSEFE